MRMRGRKRREESGSRLPGDPGAGGPGGVSRREFLQTAGLVMAGGVMLPAARGMASSGRGSGGAATEPVTVVVDATAAGPPVPSDFTGLSFERGILNSGNAGVHGYFLSPANTELVTLFRNAGIGNVRIGGNTVDQQIPAGTGADGYTGVDQLFAFAAAAGANVIYSFRMSNPSASPIPNLVPDDASAAQYIWQHYSGLVNSYAIGNEPDWHSYHVSDPAIHETNSEPGSAYPSYLEDWRKFAAAIQNVVPEARFSGPDTGNYGTRGGLPYVTNTPTQADGVSWTEQFADDEGGSGRVKDLTQHLYVGGSPFDTTGPQAIANMLSADWVEQTEIGTQPTGTGSATPTAYVPYPWLYTHNLAPVVARGLPFRLTESNDYLNGIAGASDVFAAALWALDYMHWWAAHGASGVNFHNKQWIYTDTVTPAPGTYDPNTGTCSAPGCGNYRVTPKGYAMKAFDLGAQGSVKPASVSKPPDVNVTAYAVGSDSDLYVTVINKTYGSGASDAQVTIVPTDFRWTEAASITLAAGEPGNESSATATLGGAAITNSGPWQGGWTALPNGSQGRIAVTVPATTAMVVRVHAQP